MTDTSTLAPSSGPRTAAEEETLVKANLSLVHRAVADLTARMPRHAPRDDLRSAGLLGLAQAARNFDDSLGVPFHRYAARRVKGALLDELRQNDWASRPVRAKARHLDLAVDKLTRRLDRPPFAAEIAAEMGITAAGVHALTNDLHRATVLNYDALVVTGDADAVLLRDNRGPEGVLLMREQSAYLVDAIRSLPERLQVVVRGYFFEDRSMSDLGVELGVSESRISQLRAEALELLRDGMNSQLAPSKVEAPTNPNGRVARRKAAYYEKIAKASTAAARLDSAPRY
ncbi:MAG: sigma-70 family RNA polymerase sigma factor [Acidimicrobiales bacterium]